VRQGRPSAARDLWRALPGDVMGWMIMQNCGIQAPTRKVQVGDVTALLVEDRRVARWFRVNRMPVSAQTVGRYVFSLDPVPPHILAHELEHIRQWERFGPLYLGLYFGLSALAVLSGRRPYWDNVFEVAARRRAELEMAALPADAGSAPGTHEDGR